MVSLSDASMPSGDRSAVQKGRDDWTATSKRFQVEGKTVREEALPRRSGNDEATPSTLSENMERDARRVQCRAKATVGIVVLAILIATIVDLACHDNVRGWLNTALDWIENNPSAGVFVFAVIFGISALLFVPGVILTVGAGLAFARAVGFGWGLLLGTVAVLLGAYAACIAAFYLGRYVLHEQAQRCAEKYRILGAVNRAIETNGIKVMILLRLSPLVPFSGFNFIAGLTKASVREYLIGCSGMIPGTVAFVFIGASTAGTMTEGNNMESAEGDEKTACLIRMIVLIVGVCAAVIGLVFVTIYARRALKEALQASEDGKGGDELGKEAGRDCQGDCREDSKVEICGSSSGESTECDDDDNASDISNRNV